MERVASTGPGTELESPVKFAYAPVGGSVMYSLPKTGVPEIDVEVAIITRCLDRLLTSATPRGVLPPPSTTRAALAAPLAPVPNPGLVSADEELSPNPFRNPPPPSSLPLSDGLGLSLGSTPYREDPGVMFNADGTVRSRPVPASPGAVTITPSSLSTKTFKASHLCGAGEAPDLEFEVRVIRRSLESLVRAFNGFAPAIMATRPQKKPTGPRFPVPKALPPIGGEPSVVTTPRSVAPSPAATAKAEFPPAPSEPSASPSQTEPTGSTSVAEPTSTADAPAEISQDLSFWGTLARYCHYGVGTFQFQLHELGNRLQLAKASEAYGLQKLADALFNYPVCVFTSKELRYFVRKPTLGSGETESRVSYVEIQHRADPPGTLVDGQRTVGRTCRGIVYYLGTAYGRKPWRNPTTVGYPTPVMDVTVSSCSMSTRPADVVNMDMCYFITKDRPESWVQIDFKNHLVIPKAYSFASAHSIYAGYYPRTWELRASRDGREWVCLRRHENDQTLNRYNPVGYWLIEATVENARTLNTASYSMFRIVQLGLNTFGGHELQLSSFEVYGQVMFISEHQPAPVPTPARLEEHTRSPSPPPEMPPPPKAGGKRKGGGRK
eukprot:RCo004493